MGNQERQVIQIWDHVCFFTLISLKIWTTFALWQEFRRGSTHWLPLCKGEGL